MKLSELKDILPDNWTVSDVRMACQMFQAQEVTISDRKTDIPSKALASHQGS